MKRQHEFIIKRLINLVPVILGATIIVYFLINMTGDPVRIMLGPMASQEEVMEARRSLGLDQPIYIRYFYWLGDVLQGDLGVSIRKGKPVLTMILERLGNTLILTISALIIAIGVAIPAGVISAVKQDTWIDNVSRFISIFWISMPMFWLGLILIMIFGVHLEMFPVYGMNGPLLSVNGLRSLVLPAVTLGLPQVALYTRLTRSSMLDELREDYVVTARGKGIKEWTVVVWHSLRNALIPVITMISLRVPWLFGGSVLVEEVFAWPGIGRLLANSILQRDYPVVMGIVLVIIVLVVIVNLIADIIYAYLDPRIDYDS
ncbi:ABC transporter permease [Natrialba sp. PRR66]|uniref:ABC transporter permease n=1 Tax=Natrialba sp. PRR66 TaxID=3098146 RepID=UPI002B1D4775|nr:ABC transporter permease [Natrialba sp. PRR66]